MNDLRQLINSRLSQIDNIEFNNPYDDVEAGTTYFNYLLQVSYDNWDLNEHGDFDKNYIMKVSLNGMITRMNSDNENTLKIIDEALYEIKQALKDLNFKYSYMDLTMENNIRKIQVIGTVKYSEINNQLIV